MSGLPEQRQLYLRTTWPMLQAGSRTVRILPTLPWAPRAPRTPCARVLQTDTLLEAPLPPVAIALPTWLQGGPQLLGWGIRPPAQTGMGPILKETTKEVVMYHLPFSNVCCYAAAVLQSWLIPKFPRKLVRWFCDGIHPDHSCFHLGGEIMACVNTKSVCSPLSKKVEVF